MTTQRTRRTFSALTVGLLSLGFGLGSIAATPRDAEAAQNRWNFHLETGPLITLDQPAFGGTQPERLVKDAGAHFLLQFEAELSEWIGLEVAWAPNVVLAANGGSADTQQNLLVGARFRPWWNSGGYIVGRRRSPDEKIKARDFFSDAWVDAHFGVMPSGHARVTYDVGVGARLPIVAPLQVGVFVRFAQLFAIDGDFDTPTYKQLSAGLEFSVGFSPVHPVADEDGDGVPDKADRCPGTPKGALVNAEGCSSKNKSSAPPRCSDTDFDGVCDGQDQCPDTPLGTAVDEVGCPTAAPADAQPDAAQPAR